MKGFTFQTTRQIVSEPGSSAQIGAILKGLGATRVLMGARRSAGTISVMVLDDGCGISPADRERIFDDYVSGSGPGPSGNFGLGLSTSRRFARALGGDLMLDARWKGGACFTLTLPEALGSD